MRKHFLLLFLMALLPLAGWAEDIIVTPGVISKAFGDADPTTTTGMFSMTGTDAGNKNAVKNHLTFARIQNGETVGYSYSFTLIWDGEQVDGKDIIVTGNGTLNIVRKDLSKVDDPTIEEQQFHVGKWNAPEFTIAGLEKGVDYTIDGYTNSADGDIVGIGNGNKVTVTGIGNYKGTEVYTFNIVKRNVGTGAAPADGIQAVFEEYDYTYNGDAVTIPTYTIMETVGDEQIDITENFDFDATGIADLTNAGNKEIIATAKGGTNYDGSFAFAFTIKGKPIAGLTFAQVPNVTYKAAAYEPTPTVTDGNYVLTGTDAPTYSYVDNVNAGPAKVIVTGHGNYAGTYEIPFTINKKPLSEINVTAIGAKTYKAAAWEPDVEITALANPTIDASALPKVYDDTDPLNPTGDYSISYANNIDASTAEVKATVTITSATENSNYSGSQTVEFTINKAVLTVTPKNYTIALNEITESNPSSAVLVSSENYTITGFVGGQTVLSAGVSGAPVFTIDRSDLTVGTKAGAITIADPAGLAGLSAQNYSFVAGAAANLIINARSNVTIAFKDNIEAVYGDADALTAITTPTNAANYINVEGLDEGDEVVSMTIAFVDAEGNAVVPKNYGTYYLKATPASIDLNQNDGNYNFADVEIENGVFQITKRPIEFTAVNQTLTYGEDPSTTTGNDHIVLTAGSYAYTDGRSDMNFTLEVADSYNGSVGEHEGVLILGATNDNYKFTLHNGNILVVAGAGALDLSVVADDEILGKIQDYNNVACNVVIPFNRTQELGGEERSWAAEQWNTLVLPFDITVRKLSSTLGYAIVNVVDADKSTENNVKFKLKMDATVIPAHTPFLVKTDAPVSGNITFEGVTVKTTADAYPSIAASNKTLGYKFVGAYETKTINTPNSYIRFLLGSYEKWAYISKTGSSWSIVPFAAYVDLTPAAEGREVTFTMEEIDGSTTTIRSVAADAENGQFAAEGWYTLDGVKLNAAPAQKGIYINNGKKVVLK